MTLTGPVFRYGNGGNIARAQFCNRRHAALMLRIHADGSTNTSLHGFQTLYPAWHKGWTDDIYKRSLKAAQLVQAAAVRATGAASLALVKRTDLTGFNWANVPAILVECGFMSNPAEQRLLQSSSYEWKVARGLTAGTSRAAAWPRSCTAARFPSSVGDSTSSTAVSPDSNCSRSSTSCLESSSFRRNSSARGSAAGLGRRRSVR